jgi:hypothetical protein
LFRINKNVFTSDKYYIMAGEITMIKTPADCDQCEVKEICDAHNPIWGWRHSQGVDVCEVAMHTTS